MKDKPRTRVLSLDEEALLLDALNPRFQRFVRFALGTGARLDEIRGIDPDRDINWQDGTVHVLGKFKKERDIPMQPDAAAALKEQLEECGRDRGALRAPAQGRSGSGESSGEAADCRQEQLERRTDADSFMAIRRHIRERGRCRRPGRRASRS